MPKFEDLRRVVEASADAGLSVGRTRDLIDGYMFEEAKEGEGLIGLLKTSLEDDTRRERLLDIFESRSQEPLPLSQLVFVFEKFSALQRSLEQELTPADFELLDFSVKYIENWFYRGSWTHVPDRPETQNDFAYFSVPAGIINFISKIKESHQGLDRSQDRVPSLEWARLRGLVEDVGQFGSDVLDISHLQQEVEGLYAADTKEAIDALPSAFGDVREAPRVLRERGSILATFLRSRDSVSRQLLMQYEPTLDIQPRKHSATADFYFMKNCMMAAEIARRQDVAAGKHVFIPDARFETSNEADAYKLFSFDQSPNPRSLNRMHYAVKRIPFCKFVVEFLYQNSVARNQ